MQDKINCFLSDLCLKELSHQTHAVTLNMLYLYKLEYLLLIYLLSLLIMLFFLRYYWKIRY